MIHLLLPFFWLLSLIAGLPSAPEGKSVDYRYVQSTVRTLPIGPKSPAYAVCDMMETFTGIPMRLDAEALRAHEEKRGESGSMALYYQYLLERQGLVRSHPGLDSTNQAGYAHYLCPAGSVLSFAEASKINSPGKVVSLLNEGIKGIVVTYAYCPKEWRNGNADLRLKKKTHRPKGQHTVLIVGYQDSSFIFKNSWGPGWGEAGYGRMSFAYHYNHAREGLVAYLAEAREPVSSETAKVGLKLTPEFLEGKPHLQAAIVAVGPGKLPPIVGVEYALVQGDAKSLKKALLMENAKSTGYPCLLPIPDTQQGFHLRVTLKIQGVAAELNRDFELNWGPAELEL